MDHATRPRNITENETGAYQTARTAGLIQFQ